MITLAFFCFSSVSVFCVVFDAKSTLSDAFFFGVFGFGTVLFLVLRRFPRVTRRGSSSGGGQICQNAEIPPSFMSLPYIFCKRMHLQYIAALSYVNTLGLCPKTPLSLARPQGRVVTTYPYGECWAVKIAKRSEADGAGNLSRLAEATALRLGLYRLGSPAALW